MSCEAKNRKKLEGTWIASPAFSAASSFAYEVIPLLPSWLGQSLEFMTRTGTTSHQIGAVLTSTFNTRWLWFGDGTKKLAGGGGNKPSCSSANPKSSRDACMVQVPAGYPGPGHCVYTNGLALNASGNAPNKLINVLPSAGPQLVPLTTPVHDMASLGF